MSATQSNIWTKISPTSLVPSVARISSISRLHQLHLWHITIHLQTRFEYIVCLNLCRWLSKYWPKWKGYLTTYFKPQHWICHEGLGEHNIFLHIEARHVVEGLFLTQSQYVYNLLQHKKMLEAKPMSSPMSSSQKLSLFLCAPYEDPSNDRSVVGRL